MPLAHHVAVIRSQARLTASSPLANLRMPYEIAYSKAAAKALIRAPRLVALRIRDKLRDLRTTHSQ